MPSLKIGCRVTHKSGGSAVLKAYDGASGKPWLLEMSSGSLWASHDEFYNPDHASMGMPMRPVYAAPDPLRAQMRFPRRPANEILSFNFLSTFFRRLAIHSHASPADHK